MADLTKLRHTVAVATEGTYSAAAQAIPMSQSALTRSIQSIEREYGITLFDRGRSGARLTREGKQFIALAERLIRHAEAIDDDLRGLREGTQVTVAFGIGAASAFTFLPTALPGLLDSLDGLRARVRIGANSDLRDLLRGGEIEFYIGGVPIDASNTMAPSGLVLEPIAATSHIELLVRAGHPLLAVSAEDPAIGAYPVVAGTFVRDALAEIEYVELGIQRPSIEVDDYSLLTDLVRASDAVLVTSSIFTGHRELPGVQRLPLKLRDRASVNYALIRSAEHQLSPAARRVADHLISIITQAL